MHFYFVEAILAALGLRNPKLEVLEADTNPYQTTLYQHRGNLNVSEDRFFDCNVEACRTKYIQVIQHAKTKHSSLLISPEYSCPWSIIQDILSKSERQPEEGKLWVLGCESITPSQIRQLKYEYSSGSNVFVEFEENVLRGAGHFLDPVCYIFKTQTENHVEVLVCLVQFKTVHMGVRRTDIERENYIAGERIYIFRNAPMSIYLFTLICSEALVFEMNLLETADDRWQTTAYIIVNIQLNPDPNNTYFREFRKKILDSGKELISLNWCQGSYIGSKDNPLDKFPRSGFQTDADGIDFENDVAFINNHKNGLYYSHLKPKFHVFHLNGRIELFQIQNTKPFQGVGPLPLKRRNGPTALSCHEFCDNYALQQTIQIDDGLSSFMTLIGSTNRALLGNDLSPIEKERLICLSAGDIGPNTPHSWFRLDLIKHCDLDDHGKITRITFAQDHEGNEVRTQYLDKLDQLNAILQRPDLIPNNLSFLKGTTHHVTFKRLGGQKIYSYNFNLFDLNGNKATGAFCGRIDSKKAQKVFDNLARLFTSDDQQRKRVVVWYEPTQGNIERVYDTNQPSINDDYSADPTSIQKLK